MEEENKNEIDEVLDSDISLDKKDGIGCVLGLVLLILGGLLFYGGKHFIHRKCVEGALEMHCERNYNGFKNVESVDVAWWRPFYSDKYNCLAKIGFENGTADIMFSAQKARLGDVLKDDWDANWGIWGWLGDDYRIMDVKKQDK